MCSELADDGADARMEPTPADQVAIAVVVGRRRCLQDPDGQRLDLRDTSLPFVNWEKANFEAGRADRGGSLAGHGWTPCTDTGTAKILFEGVSYRCSAP